MPHIKVRPFDTDRLNDLVDSETFRFHATAQKGDGELLGVMVEDEEFMLEIRKRDEAYLIKSDKVSRPLDANKVKKVLTLLVQEADLELLHSNIALSSRAPMADEYAKEIKDFESPDFPYDKIAIEVGFGSGRHLLYQAKEHPDTLFIGIEIHTPSAQQVLKQIHLQELENIWVVNYDARLLLEMMPSNSCTMIYVHFPVPWDKKPHRRVISERFLTESMRALAPGGSMELRTDSDNYYRYALEVFSSYPKIDFSVAKNRDLPVVSKYEDRWRRQEKDIYTVTVQCEELSPPGERSFDFGFTQQQSDMGEETIELPRKPIVLDDYFVHFERRYRLQQNDGEIIKCAFGSFDKPEHKYIYSTHEEVRYYPTDPVRTEVNHHAHQKIGEFIHG